MEKAFLQMKVKVQDMDRPQNESTRQRADNIGSLFQEMRRLRLFMKGQI